MGSVILRRKNSPDSPPIAGQAISADLENFDLVDEHGNLLSEEAHEQVRKLQQEQHEPQKVATKTSPTEHAKQASKEPPKEAPKAPPAPVKHSSK